MPRKKRKTPIKKKNKLVEKVKDFIDLKTNIPTKGKKLRKPQQKLATTEFYMDTVGEDPADKRLGRIGDSRLVRLRRRLAANSPVKKSRGGMINGNDLVASFYKKG